MPRLWRQAGSAGWNSSARHGRGDAHWRSIAGRVGHADRRIRASGACPHVNRIFEGLGYAHRVLRYELYDNAGNLTFTSVSTALWLAPEVEEVPRGFPATETAVTLHNRSNAAVSQFAVLTNPTRMSGGPDGTLIVYLDQSEQANALSGYF